MLPLLLVALHVATIIGVAGHRHDHAHCESNCGAETLAHAGHTHEHGAVSHCDASEADTACCPSEIPPVGDSRPEPSAPQHDHGNCVVCQLAANVAVASAGQQLPALEATVQTVCTATAQLPSRPLLASYHSRAPPVDA